VTKSGSQQEPLLEPEECGQDGLDAWTIYKRQDCSLSPKDVRIVRKPSKIILYLHIP